MLTVKTVESIGNTNGFCEEKFEIIVSPVELVIGDQEYKLPPITFNNILSPLQMEVSSIVVFAIISGK